MKSFRIRLLAVCLTILCLLFGEMSFFSASASTKKPQEGEKYVVIAKNLNVRSKPGVKGKVQTKLKKGTTVTYRKSQRKWWYVDYPNGSGYVYRRYLKKKDAELITSVSSDKTATHTTTRKLRIRDKPSLRGKILAILDKGVELTVLSKKGKWAEISYNKQTAWVSSKYLKIKK